MEDSSSAEEYVYLTDIERYIWVTGIITSAACLLSQALLFIYRPKVRKLDQKILAQLTVARFINTVTEYLLSDHLFHVKTRDLLFGLYYYSDILLICWMFVYTKNLYDKVVRVFTLQTQNFLLVSVLVWILGIPMGILGVVFLSVFSDYYEYFYRSYAIMKYIVLFLNMLFFCRIFYVIIIRKKNDNQQFLNIIKICVMSLLLICIAFLQILLTDLSSFFTEDDIVTNTFCLINSFQALAITLIFIVLVKNS